MVVDIFQLPVFSTDLEAILVEILLALCDFKSLRFEIAAIPICDVGIFSLPLNRNEVYNFLPDGPEDGEKFESEAWGEDERLVADLLMRLHEASRGTSQIRHNLGVAGVGDPGRTSV